MSFFPSLAASISSGFCSQNEQKSASAFAQDISFDSLPKDVREDVLRFAPNAKGKKIPQYGIVIKELIPKCDPVNLATARKTVKGESEKKIDNEFYAKVKGDKFVLLNNDRVVDGHHFIAKGERAGATCSVNALDLTPLRFQKGAAGPAPDSLYFPRLSEFLDTLQFEKTAAPKTKSSSATVDNEEGETKSEPFSPEIVEKDTKEVDKVDEILNSDSSCETDDRSLAEAKEKLALEIEKMNGSLSKQAFDAEAISQLKASLSGVIVDITSQIAETGQTVRYQKPGNEIVTEIKTEMSGYRALLKCLEDAA